MHVSKFRSTYSLDFFFVSLSLLIFNLMWIFTLFIWWQSWDNQQFNSILVISIILWFLSLFYLFHTCYKHFSQKLILDETGVTYKTGIIFVRKSRVPYFKINNIVIEKFLFLDNIRLETGNDNTDIYCKHVENGEQVKRQIELLMLKSHDQIVMIESDNKAKNQ
jgi:membrane protein YdbS with pleckstrin-like domain